jgi:hypothetical protein
VAIVRRALPFVLVAVAVAAAVIAANLLLLGHTGGGSDPVGNLNPVQPGLTAPSTTTTVAPPPTTEPGEGADDD